MGRGASRGPRQAPGRGPPEGEAAARALGMKGPPGRVGTQARWGGGGGPLASAATASLSSA